MLLRAYFNETYLSQRMLGCSAGTVYQYRLTIGRFSANLQRDALVADLTDATVAAFMRAYSQGRSPATTNTALAHLCAVANYAARQGLCGWLAIKKLKEYRRVPRARTVEEVAQLLGYCDTLSGRFGPAAAGPAWKALFATIYDTALRIGACLSIRQDDCDLTRRWVLARAEGQKQKADQVLRISEATADYLEEIWQPSRELVWTWHLKPRTFYWRLDKIIAGAGLPHDGKSKFHCLRRTSLSYTAAAHGLGVACEKAGHSSLEMTRRYIDPTICPMQDTLPPRGQTPRPSLKIFAG
jgi:integrase